MNGTRHQYAVYGACLDSAMPFPELRPANSAAPRWTFDTTPALAPMHDARELGADRIYGDVHARLHSHSGGHRIQVDDTGSFDLSADRRRIVWEERAESWPDFVRAHLMGRVLATALYLDGLLPLHASAVETHAGVIGFLAPKGFGKSTLALALAAAGARLVTDDTLPVEPGGAPHAWPGVHSLRVHDDAIAAVGLARPELETREGKRLVTDLGSDRLLMRRAPLAAVYLLDPVLPGTASVTREALSPMLAAISLVGHVKIGRMLGPAAAGAMLERAALITHGVPTFRLRAPRDLERLPDTARAVLAWHGGAAA